MCIETALFLFPNDNKFHFLYRDKETDAKSFADNLRQNSWDFDSGTCGNDVVIFLSKIDRQVSNMSVIAW